MSVSVTLVTHTPEPDRVVAYAARLCYSSKSPEKIWEEVEDVSLQRRVIGAVVKRGHHSVLEHAVFTFLIEGCSRVCTHQLVRHRIASYSHRSHRYTKIGEGSFSLPPSIEADGELMALYEEHLERSVELYNKLLEMGVPREDARFVVPQAVTSPILVTMNARELLHFFGLRLCTRAQWEIRRAAALMLNAVKEVAPIIFERAGPRCWSLGYCPEGDEKCFEKIGRRWLGNDS